MRRIVRHRRRGRGRRSDPIRTLRHGGHPHRRSPKHEVRRDDRLHAEKRIRDLHGSHGSRRVEMQRHPQLAELHGDGSRRLGSGSRSRRRHHDRDHLAGRTHDELHAQRSRPRREHFADLRRRRDDQKPHLLLRQEPRLPLLVRKHLFAQSRSSRGLDDGNRPRKQPVDRHGADARQSESDADRCGQGDAAERPRHGRRIVVDQRRALDQDARHPVRRADRPLRLRRTAQHPLHDAVCRQVRHHGPRRLDGRTGYRRIDAQSHRTCRRGRNPRRHGHTGCGFGRGADRIVRNAALAERHRHGRRFRGLRQSRHGGRAARRVHAGGHGDPVAGRRPERILPDLLRRAGRKSVHRHLRRQGTYPHGQPQRRRRQGAGPVPHARCNGRGEESDAGRQHDGYTAQSRRSRNPRHLQQRRRIDRCHQHGDRHLLGRQDQLHFGLPRRTGRSGQSRFDLHRLPQYRYVQHSGFGPYDVYRRYRRRRTHQHEGFADQLLEQR